MALESLKDWTPFSIDALGLVTMLGAEEIDRAIGRLVQNPWVDYLPYLGGFVVAGNKFVQPLPGTTLYNISDGIKATNVSGWMTRWLAKQEPKWNTTTFIWSVRQVPARNWKHHGRASVIGAVFNGGLLVLSVLTGDWFGFANTIALIVMVIVRCYMVEQNRIFLDRVVASLSGPQAEFIKAFCILSDGRAVTLFAPRGLIVEGFLTTPRPYQRSPYRAARALCWLAFGFHVVCIGQATLFIQILTVVGMISATVLCCLGWGCNEYDIGRLIRVHPVSVNGQEDRRVLAYARLDLSDKEEDSMLAWGLVPQRTNRLWWGRYVEAKASMGSQSPPYSGAAQDMIGNITFGKLLPSLGHEKMPTHWPEKNIPCWFLTRE